MASVQHVRRNRPVFSDHPLDDPDTTPHALKGWSFELLRSDTGCCGHTYLVRGRSLDAPHPRPRTPAMVDTNELHEIVMALRALQMRAVVAGSLEAEAFLAMTTCAIHDMAVKAEKDQQPLARNLAEMMRRLRSGRLLHWIVSLYPPLLHHDQAGSRLFRTRSSSKAHEKGIDLSALSPARS